jgi:hypothetical protein
MQALQNKIPGLQDTLEQPIAFETWRLELVESDVKEPARHRIAVLFQTPTLQVLQVFGNQFVVKYANSPQVPDGAMHPCFTITWQAGMAINAISFDHTPSELAVLLS